MNKYCRNSPIPLQNTPADSYGHTTLHGAVNRSKLNRAGYIWGRNCSHCGNHHQKRSQYCSNACKQRAYRLRHDPECGSSERRKQRAQRSVATKQFKSKKIICECCGQEFFVSIAESTNRIYCSNACKQRSYRTRKKSV